MITLYDKYGGFDTFSAVVGNFYQKILDSEEPVPYFESVNMEKLMSHQTQFIATALGGPDKYANVDLQAVHASYKITVPHFNEVVEFWKNHWVKAVLLAFACLYPLANIQRL